MWDEITHSFPNFTGCTVTFGNRNLAKKFHPTQCNKCNYLSFLGFQLHHVSKRGHWYQMHHKRHARSLQFTHMRQDYCTGTMRTSVKVKHAWIIWVNGLHIPQNWTWNHKKQNSVDIFVHCSVIMPMHIEPAVSVRYLRIIWKQKWLMLSCLRNWLGTINHEMKLSSCNAG